MRAVIERLIREYLADPDPCVEWVRAKVREEHFLPLDLGWVEVIGIRPDQTLVRWDHEGTGAVTELERGRWARFALVRGARRYPELASLIPARPADALICGQCGGSGGIPGPHDILCVCGGVGWTLPGEAL